MSEFPIPSATNVPLTLARYRSQALCIVLVLLLPIPAVGNPRRDTVAQWLAANKVLAMSPSMARVLADSLPSGLIGGILLMKGPDLIHLCAECAQLPQWVDTNIRDTSETLSTCVFSTVLNFYVAILKEGRLGTSIVWDTATWDNVPQPTLRIERLRKPPDSSPAVIVSSLATGARGMRRYVIIDIAVGGAHIAAVLSGTDLKSVDLDGDGIAELKTTDIIDYKTGATVERYYKFDAKKGQFESIDRNSNPTPRR